MPKVKQGDNILHTELNIPESDITAERDRLMASWSDGSNTAGQILSNLNTRINPHQSVQPSPSGQVELAHNPDPRDCAIALRVRRSLLRDDEGLALISVGLQSDNWTLALDAIYACAEDNHWNQDNTIERIEQMEEQGAESIIPGVFLLGIYNRTFDLDDNGEYIDTLRNLLQATFDDNYIRTTYDYLRSERGLFYLSELRHRDIELFREIYSMLQGQAQQRSDSTLDHSFRQIAGIPNTDLDKAVSTYSQALAGGVQTFEDVAQALLPYDKEVPATVAVRPDILQSGRSVDYIHARTAALGFVDDRVLHAFVQFKAETEQLIERKYRGPWAGSKIRERDLIVEQRCATVTAFMRQVVLDEYWGDETNYQYIANLAQTQPDIYTDIHLEMANLIAEGCNAPHLVQCLGRYAEENIDQDMQYWTSNEGLEMLSRIYFVNNRVCIGLIDGLIQTASDLDDNDALVQFLTAQRDVYRALIEMDAEDLADIPTLQTLISERIEWFARFGQYYDTTTGGLGPLIRELIDSGANPREALLQVMNVAVQYYTEAELRLRIMAVPDPTFRGVLEELHIPIRNEALGGALGEPRIASMLNLAGQYQLVDDDTLREIIFAEDDRVQEARGLSRHRSFGKAILAAIIDYSQIERARMLALSTAKFGRNIVRDIKPQSSIELALNRLSEVFSGYGFREGDFGLSRQHGLLNVLLTQSRRGLGVTVKLTPAHILVHNPLHTLGFEKKVEKKDGKITVKENLTDDFIIVPWTMLKGATYKIDYNWLSDLRLKVHSFWSLIRSHQDSEGLNRLTSSLPGTVIFETGGRDKELFEIGPVSNPRVLAASLVEISNSMASGPKDGVELLAYLMGK